MIQELVNMGYKPKVLYHEISGEVRLYMLKRERPCWRVFIKISENAFNVKKLIEENVESVTHAVEITNDLGVDGMYIL